MEDSERGPCAVPALSHHGHQHPELAELRGLEGRLDGDHRQRRGHCAADPRTVLLQTTALLGILLLAFSYFWLLVPEEQQLQQLGLFCCICTISMYLSPMADLAKIIHTKSTQGLSWPLTIASLLSSACWTFYGLRFQDPYITVPNLPGILTSLLRLWLFWKYPQERDRSYQHLQT
ncbi:sugar transporter SWEET1-like [Sorex araneus]|uniref:sugar transporter SWEET1-like n=1 Tax=Sorex araneus TaxID=42254 RepID=UPI002433793A|nr:sugar transporter SWEET1-like [Sorex araneus]